MASLSNHKDGRRTIYTSGPGRPKIALGRMPKKQAEAILRHVEALEAAAIDGSAPPKATAEWLAALHAPKLRARLEKLGLCEARDAGRNATLGQLIDRFRADFFHGYTKGTVAQQEIAIGSIVKHVGLDVRVSAITAGDARRFRSALLQEGLAEATVRKRCAILSKFLRYAVADRIIDRNPFDEAKVPRGTLPTEDFLEVPAADALAVIEQLPTAQFRLLFALSRFGGLRVGSEPRLLRWGDIDWTAGTMRVRSPKTARHHGRDSRVVPIFPEILTHLEACYAEAEEGEELVLPFLKHRTDASLRKPLMAAIERAGLNVWPRLWHNLRANCQTDLINEFPGPDVRAWMGNTADVAKKHYEKATKANLERATQFERAQKGAQQAAAEERDESQPERSALREVSSPLAPAIGCDSSQLDQMTPTGFEPVLPA